MTPAFLDANVPIFATGRAHPLKERCLDILALVGERPEAFLTDAEVLQELLHRYLALRMWPRPGLPIFERVVSLMRGRIEPIYGTDVEHAASLATEHPGLDARDLLHAAVMSRLGVTRIVSADAGFDQLQDFERLDPAHVDSWRELIIQ
jgi:hypothetical protein